MTNDRLLLAAAIVVLLTSACANSSAGDDPTRPGNGPTPTTATTSAPPPTTGAPSSTTLAAPADPDGSGCTPGPGGLPDGNWYGVVLTTTAAEVEFDLACWFTGDDAVRAAAEDGAEAPPNDYYVRNENDLVRTVPVGDDAEVTWYPDFGDPSTETTTSYAEWIDLIEARDFMPGVWLDVQDGDIVAITEQWVP